MILRGTIIFESCLHGEKCNDTDIKFHHFTTVTLTFELYEIQQKWITNIATFNNFINALLYPYRVDGIKQTYKHGYIYIYKYEHTNQSYIKTNIIIMQLY